MASVRYWLGSHVALLLVLVQPCLGGDTTYLTEHPGKVSVSVDRGVPGYKVSAGETAAFNANLERLRGLLLAQPVFNPPLGVKVAGYIRWGDNRSAPLRNAPLPGYGYIRFHFYFLDKKTGKPDWICCTTDEIQLRINQPGEEFERAGLDDRWKFYLEPRQTGELSGFPVYREDDSGDEIIVLHRGAKPLWVPVTRDEYLKMWLLALEEQVAKNPADTVTPTIVERYKDALARMSEEDRQLQARDNRGNETLELPLDSPEILLHMRPIVKPNPKLFDPSLPRSAFQLLTFRFKYTGNLDHAHPGPTRYGDISPYRVWEALHRSDWAGIGAALTSK